MQQSQGTQVRTLSQKDSCGGGNSNPLQDPRLENPMDRGVSGLQSKGSQKVGRMNSHAAVPSFFQYLLVFSLFLSLQYQYHKGRIPVGFTQQHIILFNPMLDISETLSACWLPAVEIHFFVSWPRKIAWEKINELFKETKSSFEKIYVRVTAHRLAMSREIKKNYMRI